MPDLIVRRLVADIRVPPRYPAVPSTSQNNGQSVRRPSPRRMALYPIIAMMAASATTHMMVLECPRSERETTQKVPVATTTPMLSESRLVMTRWYLSTAGRGTMTAAVAPRA